MNDRIKEHKKNIEFKRNDMALSQKNLEENIEK